MLLVGQMFDFKVIITVGATPAATLLDYTRVKRRANGEVMHGVPVVAARKR